MLPRDQWPLTGDHLKRCSMIGVGILLLFVKSWNEAFPYCPIVGLAAIALPSPLVTSISAGWAVDLASTSRASSVVLLGIEREAHGFI